jgi:hypothetical protein
VTDENAALTATLKAGGGYDAPWLVVRADTPEQLTTRLDALGQAAILAKVAEVAVELHGVYNAASGLGAQAVQVEVPQHVQPVAQAGPTAPAYQAPAAPAQAAPGGMRTEQDRYGGTYELGRPDAPTTQYGPAVKRIWTAQSGKVMKRWIDPRDPKIPSVYQTNGKTPPPDLWEGSWAN